MPNFRLRNVLPWLVLMISVVMVYGFYQFTYEASKRNLRQKFEEQAEQLISNARHRLMMQQLLLRGMANLFTYGEPPTQEKFESYMKTLRRSSVMPGVVSVGFVQATKREKLRTHQSYWAKKLGSRYEVWPASYESDIAPIVFLEPLLVSGREKEKLRKNRYGFNMFSIPNRRAAMEAARDLYSTSLSGRNLLFYRDQGKKTHGFQIFFPVFRQGAPTGTIEERRKNIMGWVFSPVYPDIFVDHILEKLGHGMDMAIFASKDGSPETLMTHQNSLAAELSNRPETLQYNKLIEVGGQTWLVNIRALPSYLTQLDTRWSGITLVFGAALSLLLFLYTWSLSRSRERAEYRAREMTRELHESEYRWHFAIEGQGDGLWDWNLRENTVFYSPRFKALLGYSEDEIGTGFTEWEKRLHPDDKQGALEVMEGLVNGKLKQFSCEYRMKCKNGLWKWIRSRGIAVKRASDGYALRVLGTISDISEEKRIAFQVIRMTNLYAALGYAGQAITRSRTAEELFPEICQILVKDGGFKMAWVGLSDHYAGLPRTQFSFGMSRNYQNMLQGELRDRKSRLAEIMHEVFKKGEPLWFQDILRDASMTAWFAIAREEGWRGMGVLPIFRMRTQAGVLVVYSGDACAFDASAKDLLMEIVNDVSRALDFFTQEADRNRAEMALRESEARYSALFEESSVVLLLVEPEHGWIVNANKQAANFYGWDIKTLRSMNINQINMSPVSHVEGEMHKAVAQDKKQFVFKHLTRDGSLRDVEVFSGPVSINGRELLLSSVHDISERKQAEHALRESEKLNTTILNSLSMQIVLIDSEGNIVWVNSAWEKFTEENHVFQKETSWVGQNFYELLLQTNHPNARQESFCVIDGIQEVLSGKKEYFEVERCCVVPDSETWFYMGVTRLDGEKAGAVIVHEDITSRKNYEAKINESHGRLKELSAELIATQENERKSLARELHDELGQSFTTLRLNLHEFRELLTDEKKISLWNSTNEIVASMIGKVRSMSSLLRPPSLDHFGLEISIKQLLQNQLVRAGVAFGYEFVNVPERLPAFIEITMYRIVQEAVTNTVRHAQAKNVTVEINGGEDGKEIEMIIRDNGIGFDLNAAQMDKNKNISYGLMGMRERVLLIGGSIQIETKPGIGTTISVIIPVAYE